MSPNLLLLGGTSEASALAVALAEAGIAATFSYAGRVARPRGQPLPTRVGGFGGTEGLVRWIRDHRITHVVDATHPFAEGMSRNALAACAEIGTPLVALTRAPWTEGPGDRWRHVADIPSAVAALGNTRRRVFLGIGRQRLEAFAAAPQHFYLLRLVDPPEVPPPLPDCAIEISRGPFTTEGDIALLTGHRIELVVSKNSGGTAARAKLDAARALGLPVLMIDRPALPARHELHSVEAVMGWISHSGTARGV